MIDSKQKGMIFNVQKFSVHDGAGIRTLVFLKGCPLRCRWCSNPESQLFKPERAYNPNRCLTAEVCGRCAKACNAHGVFRAASHTAFLTAAVNEGNDALGLQYFFAHEKRAHAFRTADFV